MAGGENSQDSWKWSGLAIICAETADGMYEEYVEEKKKVKIYLQTVY